MGVRRVDLAQSLSTLGVADAALEEARAFAERHDVSLREAALKLSLIHI